MFSTAEGGCGLTGATLTLNVIEFTKALDAH
jgi:hypothetical protein